MTPAQILQNALSLFSQWRGKCEYRMGAELDGDPVGCDCSGFIAKVLGRKKFDGKTWWNTDAIYDDACGPQTHFKKLSGPQPGAIGVYPGATFAGVRHAGHVWIVDDPLASTTVECCKSGGGISRMKRLTWFRPGLSKGNGKPIIWVVPV